MTSSARLASLAVRRTARLAIRGPDTGLLPDLWIVLHGYSQLAAPFLESFAAIDDGSRLIVAPEALNRYYEGRIEERARNRSAAVVGGSWMTMEARLDDIADNLAYLDAVYAWCAPRLAADARLTVLGFSQGSATAARWVASGTAPVHRHIVWGSTFPPDVTLAAPAPLHRPDTWLVIGTRDQYATPKIVAAERARLDAAELRYRLVSFEGGHRLDDDTLRTIVSTPA